MELSYSNKFTSYLLLIFALGAVHFVTGLNIKVTSKLQLSEGEAYAHHVVSSDEGTERSTISTTTRYEEAITFHPWTIDEYKIDEHIGQVGFNSHQGQDTDKATKFAGNSSLTGASGFQTHGVIFFVLAALAIALRLCRCYYLCKSANVSPTDRNVDDGINKPIV